MICINASVKYEGSIQRYYCDLHKKNCPCLASRVNKRCLQKIEREIIDVYIEHAEELDW